MPKTNEEIAEVFGRDLDPLAKYESKFIHELDVDPFAKFLEESIYPDDEVSESVEEDYERDIRRWKEMMEDMGRHPACPKESHVIELIRRERDERGNSANYIQHRVRRINRAFSYFQNDPKWPHDTDFQPFETAKEKADFGEKTKKEHHHIPLNELSDRIQGIKHIQDRAIVVTQLKLMLRAKELRNIRLEEINIQHSDIQEAYPELGTHNRVADRPNSLYIPPNPNSRSPTQGRQGNKSKIPKVLPLDDEIRQVLIDYLLIRPDVDQPTLFLSDGYNKMRLERVNQPWHEAFRPEYGETEQHKPVSSHFGRHFTTDYLKQEAELAREKVQYLRGDVIGGDRFSGDKAAIDTYLHGHYSKVKEPYLETIFKLGI